MTKQEFTERFLSELDKARAGAEDELQRGLPSRLEVRLFGAGHPERRLDPRGAAEVLYLGEDTFYRVIDIGVLANESGEDVTTFFVVASGHRPGTFGETWNTPPGAGPFKQIGVMGRRDRK